MGEWERQEDLGHRTRADIAATPRTARVTDALHAVPSIFCPDS